MKILMILAGNALLAIGMTLMGMMTAVIAEPGTVWFFIGVVVYAIGYIGVPILAFMIVVRVLYLMFRTKRAGLI